MSTYIESIVIWDNSPDRSALFFMFPAGFYTVRYEWMHGVLSVLCLFPVVVPSFPCRCSVGVLSVFWGAFAALLAGPSGRFFLENLLILGGDVKASFVLF